MVDIATAANEAEFIESVRAIFRAYVPESDAWAQPNFFSVNATIIGGLAWTAANEARLGFDARANPQTAVGEYLDILAASPPLYLTRMTATQATGNVSVNFPALSSVPSGYTFTASNGNVYTATAATALTAGAGIVPVVSAGTGLVQNAKNNQPLSATDGTATSLGIYGGNDTECDDQFRARIFAAQSRVHFFGSACSYEAEMLAFPGVTRAWAVEDGAVAKLVFLMEGTYPCGVPLQSDIDAIKDFFTDACLVNMFFCPNFEAAKSLTIAPAITWGNCPDDVCEIETAMQDWLRANFGLGEGVPCCEIERWLKDNYPDLNPSLTCCTDYPPVPCAVYNCVELVGG